MSARARQAGFSLVEMMLATALGALVLGVVFTMVASLRSLSRDQSEILEMDMNLRAAIEFVGRDLHLAGYGMKNQRYAADLGVIFPNADSSDTWTTNSITIWQNPSDTRGTVVRPMPQPSSEIVLDQVAGFAEGDNVLIIGPGDDGLTHRDWFVVTQVQDNAGAGEKHLQHAPPTNPSDFSTRYQPGSVVIRVVVITYRAATDSAGRPGLFRREGSGAEAQVAQNITQVSFSYFNNANPAVNLTNIDTAAERKAIRSVHLDLTGQTEKKSRITHRTRQVTISAEVSPRNLGG